MNRRKFTKSEARYMFGAANDHQLAKAMETSHQRLARYGDNDQMSDFLQWQIHCLIAEGRIEPAPEVKQ